MVAIKGMDMPKRCADCRFCIRQETNDYGSYGQCMVTNCETVYTLTLSSDCPLVEIVTCKDCKHRPVDNGKQIEPPKENGRIDETCSCINADDWWYSFMPEDDYFCAGGERKA